MANRAKEWVEEYLERGFRPIPVGARSKGPTISHWPRVRIKDPDISKHFGDESNVGLILGFNGLTDVDLDSTEALCIADYFLLKTGFVFGRKSKPKSHRFYWVNEAIPSRKYLDPLAKKDNSTLLEIRCKTADGGIGLQTVVPPSRHPSGEIIRFDRDGDPAKVRSKDLIRAANYIAATALLTRYWPEERSGRNEAFLALSGALARSGVSLEDAIQLVQGIYCGLFGAHADMQQAAREVKATFEKFRVGKPTTGFNHLTDLIDKTAVQQARQWIGVQPDAERPTARADKKSPATQLVAMAQSAEFFHTPDQEAYAALEVGSHREIWRVRDKEFKLWLMKSYHTKYRSVPATQAIGEAINVLEGRALFDGQEHDVFVRIARRGNSIYLDLADQAWGAVKITASGWKVVDRPTVRFRRPRGMRPLPEPVSGGSIEEMREFVNVRCKNDWVVLVACAVGMFQFNGPDLPTKTCPSATVGMLNLIAGPAVSRWPAIVLLYSSLLRFTAS